MRARLLALALPLALHAQSALACSVCFSGRDETRMAYLGTTLFLTIPPLLGLAAAIYWVRRRGRS